MSLPSPPFSVSAPAPPVIVFLSALPVSVWPVVAAVPVRFSIVGDRGETVACEPGAHLVDAANELFSELVAGVDDVDVVAEAAPPPCPA